MAVRRPDARLPFRHRYRRRRPRVAPERRGARSDVAQDGLTWRQDSHAQPRLDVPIALTVAGLRHLPEAEPLLWSFVAMIRHLVDRKRNLVPSPSKVVEATVTACR